MYDREWGGERHFAKMHLIDTQRTHSGGKGMSLRCVLIFIAMPQESILFMYKNHACAVERMRSSYLDPKTHLCGK